MKAVKIMVDNQSAIMLSKTSAHHNRTKHIDTRYHFIRDGVEDGRVFIEHLKTEVQLANILTKSLGRVKFVELSARIRLKKAWDMKKLKEENMGAEFSSSVGTLAPAVQALTSHAWHISRGSPHDSVRTRAHTSAVTVATAEVRTSCVHWRMKIIDFLTPQRALGRIVGQKKSEVFSFYFSFLACK